MPYSRTINATKEVILCAGAFGSPEILLRSGIGSPTVLEQANIPLGKILGVHNLRVYTSNTAPALK